MAVRAQHFGQAGQSVCELSAIVATVEMLCEFRLVSFLKLVVEANRYAQPHQLAVARGEPQRSLSSRMNRLSWGAPHHHHYRSRIIPRRPHQMQ
jgi:hypothetical protein